MNAQKFSNTFLIWPKWQIVAQSGLTGGFYKGTEVETNGQTRGKSDAVETGMCINEKD